MRLFMKSNQWSVQDAKNKFSAVVDAAEHGKAQLVTRRGIPTAVVISVAEFEKLKQLEAQQLPTFIDHLLSLPTDDGEFERAPVKLRDLD
jgi:antitoxin Phd